MACHAIIKALRVDVETAHLLGWIIGYFNHKDATGALGSGESFAW